MNKELYEKINKLYDEINNIHTKTIELANQSLKEEATMENDTLREVNDCLYNAIAYIEEYVNEVDK